MAILNRPLERARPKARASLRVGPVLLAAGAMIAVIALLRVVQTSDAATTSFAIQKLEQEKLESQAVVHQLERENAKLQSLAHIEAEARALGLTAPQRRDAVQVNVPRRDADQPRLPTRYALDEEAEVEGQGSSWWRDLLDLLPF